jgi:Fic family protein
VTSESRESQPAIVPVPVLTFEDHVWEVADESASRAQRQRNNGPYRSAVTSQIAGWQLALPGQLAADVDDATAALARFDTYATTALGPGELAPMAAILLRTESTSSSNIEQITAGARQIALAEIGESGAENANQIVANVHAMEAALELADDLSVHGILQMHALLLAREPQWAGRYRDGLVWVGGEKFGPRAATHVAPQRDLVEPAMEDLVEFLARRDLPAVAHAAIAHAQFETIHPFADGNGRAGRALVHATLRAQGAVTRATAPVSAGLLRDTDAYFGALTSYRRGDGRPIIEQFASAARYAAARGSVLVDDLAAQIRESERKLAGIRSDAAARRVVPLLVGQPVVSTSFIQQQLGLVERAAFRAIDTLVERGVIEERTGRNRHRVFQHAGILDVLDAFAADIRRS